MKKLLVLFCLTFSPLTFAGEFDQKANWESHTFSMRAMGLRTCWVFRNYVQLVVGSLEHRNFELTCSYGRDGMASFETLRSHPAGGVNAEWTQQQIFVSIQEPYECYAATRIFETILQSVDIRNLQYSSFCNPGSGAVQFNFETLALP